MKFQFTPLREGRRRCMPTTRSRQSYFNSRPSARGDLLGEQVGGRQEDFNSRPSARGDIVIRPSPFVSFISIHAPPRGATIFPILFQPPSHISIHAPPRGATVSFNREQQYRIFQFTPLREGRQGCQEAIDAIMHFNSRPSARGDPRRNLHRIHLQHFNSRPSARGDLMRFISFFLSSISIHAPPRGATCHKDEREAETPRFQFTPLREGRQW